MLLESYKKLSSMIRKSRSKNLININYIVLFFLFNFRFCHLKENQSLVFSNSFSKLLKHCLKQFHYNLNNLKKLFKRLTYRFRFPSIRRNFSILTRNSSCSISSSTSFFHIIFQQQFIVAMLRLYIEFQDNQVNIFTKLRQIYF